VILFSSIAGSILYGPLPYSSDPYSDEFLVKKEGVKTAREMFKLIPPKASVSAANNLAVHLCNREKVFPFPYDYEHLDEDPEYIVINMAKPYYGTHFLKREEFNERLRESLLQHNYGVFYFKDGYTILKKNYKNKSGVKKIALTTDKPAHIVDVKLNNEIDFWGYTLNTPTIRPMIPFRIVYFWKASRETDYEYYMLIKLVDENWNIVFQQDHEPVYGLYPTSTWKENERINEVYWVELPITVRPGIYHIYVGISENVKQKSESMEEAFQGLGNLKKVGTITVQKY